jgi:Xaa-Pro aminopeptidase
LVPPQEFELRLDNARREMARLKLDAAIVYGDNYSFADLCYLTNYFPKVRGGIAVVPREGAISMLLNIGSRDVPFAKTLTWVDDVRASNQLGADAAKLVKEKKLDKSHVGLVDSGRGFSVQQLDEMKAALPEVEWATSDALVAPLRREKTWRELAALRGAGHILAEVCDEARSFIKRGRKEYEVIADIDRMARDKGAEDIRLLAGERRLQPPSFKQGARLQSHWAVYLAIQHERYWAEAGRTYIFTDDEKMQSAYRKAQHVVDGMAAHLRPGNAVAAIEEIARKQLNEFYPAASIYGLGNGIGLNQWEAPFFNENDAAEVGAPDIDTATLNEGMTLALRATFESEAGLLIYGNSYEVTSGGPRSLLGE